MEDYVCVHSVLAAQHVLVSNAGNDKGILKSSHQVYSRVCQPSPPRLILPAVIWARRHMPSSEVRAQASITILQLSAELVEFTM